MRRSSSRIDNQTHIRTHKHIFIIAHNDVQVNTNGLTNPLKSRMSHQPQALGTSFGARVRDYMAAHTERMESGSNPEMPVKEAEKENEAENGAKNEPIKRAEREEAVEAPKS
ncbi:hypothetical protein Tco_1103236 [Tanacetum coccineum]